MARIEADLARVLHADVLGDLACCAPPKCRCVKGSGRNGRTAHPGPADRPTPCRYLPQNLRAASRAPSFYSPQPGIAPAGGDGAGSGSAPGAPGAVTSPRPAHPAALDIGERVALAGGADSHALAAAWATACAGRSATVLVSGDAGIGKSRAVREFARTVQHGEGIVLHGRCALNWRSPTNHSWSACPRPSRPVRTESLPTSPPRSSPNSPGWSPTWRAGGMIYLPGEGAS